MAVTFHPVPIGSRGLACDQCGSLVDPSEEGRTAHGRWHKERAELSDEVIDLRQRLSA